MAPFWSSIYGAGRPTWFGQSEPSSGKTSSSQPGSTCTATWTEEFANKTDIWTVYRTAPHRDAPQTLERGNDAPRALYTPRPSPKACLCPRTYDSARRTGNDRRRSDENAAGTGFRNRIRQPGILTAEILVGFGWADAAYSSSSVAVIAENEAHLPHARRQARRLAQAMWDQRNNYSFDQEVASSADEAIDLALEAEEDCVFIARFRGQSYRGHTWRCSPLSVSLVGEKCSRRDSGPAFPTAKPRASALKRASAPPFRSV